MSKLRRVVLVTLGVALLVVLGVCISSYVWLRSTLPPASGTIAVEGLAAPVEIDFDTMGVPHVWAATERDAYFALGWLHAADRLFQMELLRRSADGRLSELFGEAALETDVEQRRIGHRRLAASAPGDLDPPARDAIQAYVAGVNAYLARSTPPFEFRLLDTTPAPWSVEDVLAIASFQSWYSDDLSDTADFVVQKVLDGMAPAQAETLLPAAPATTAGAVARWMLPDAAAVTSLVRSLRMSRASNAWALAPGKSVSGQALFANDPHTQGRDLPGLWYIAGLHAVDTGLDVVGVTAPGMPFVGMGHSRHAAWAITAAGVDLRDHYVETVNPDDPGEYLTPEGWRAFEIRSESIAVRGRPAPVRLDVKWTRHGPVVRENAEARQAVAWRWAGFDFSPAAVANAAVALPHVTGWDRFWELLGDSSGGAFNWVFASASGDIGYGMGSPVPLRPFDDSVLPVDGSTDDHEWQGYASRDRKPHVVNPPDGWVANANNAPDASGLGERLTGLGFLEDRILRARQILSGKDRFDVADMIAAQLDRTDLSALRWKADAIRMLEPLSGSATSELRAWNGSMDRDSRPAAVVNTWLGLLNRDIFTDELGGPVPRAYFEAVLARADSPWYDDTRTPRVETRDDILRRAMQEAFDEAAGRTWGQMAPLTLAHPMGRVPLVGRLLRLRRGPFPWGGSPGSLNSNFYRTDPGGGYVQGITPAWRHIVDFGDLDNALVSVPAGQSGNPMSPHFFDFWPLWRTGSYWKVPLTRERVRERLSTTLVLRPAAR